MVGILVAGLGELPPTAEAAPLPAAVPVKDIRPGAAGSNPSGFALVNGVLFFIADDGVHGRELWRTDGTPQGTVLVADINPGPNSAFFQTTTYLNGIPWYPPDDGAIANVNGTLFFGADDGVHGVELWRSDGTAEGTVLVADINPGPAGSGPRAFVEMNGVLFFLANDGTHGSELWRTDGTAAGTRLVKDIYSVFPGAGCNCDSLTTVNGTLFFVADDEFHGFEVWKSDGTGEGTVLLRDINPSISGGVSAPHPGGLADLNGSLTFGHDDGVHGLELWQSDGTAEGTVLLADIVPGLAGSYAGFPIAVNGTLFFRASDDLHGTELWRSDGTTEGTVLVADINPGPDWSRLFDFAKLQGGLNSTLFFRADDGLHGRELWTSDGTAERTRLVADIRAGPGGSDPPYPVSSRLTDASGVLCFVADDGIHGAEPWVSDGTATGTRLVADVRRGPETSAARCVTQVNGALLFVADDGIHGFELFRAVRPLALSVNQASFRSGESLRVDVSLTNAGSGGLVDVYFGARLPPEADPDLQCPSSDPVAFLTDGFTSVVLTCLSASPATFAPLLRSALVPASAPETVFKNFFTFVWTPDMPAGSYIFFLVVTAAGALDDGRVDTGDLLATAVATLTFVP